MDEIIIGDIIFTPQKRIINKGGSTIKIRNKESEVLALLCHNYPISLSREDIEKEIWGGSYVTDNTLTQTISNLRNALDDKEHELVTTIPKKGYCIGIKPTFISGKDIGGGKFSETDCFNVVRNRYDILSGIGIRCKIVILSVFVFFFLLHFISHRATIKLKLCILPPCLY